VKKRSFTRKYVDEAWARSDRYVVYGLIGARVDFEYDGKRNKGVVDKVLRSVFDETVSLWVDGKEVVLDEPRLMFRDGDEVVFLYGDLDGTELGDEELFEEARGAGFSGETVDDVLKRTRKGDAAEVRFKILEEVIPVEDVGRDGKPMRKSAAKKAIVKARRKAVRKKAVIRRGKKRR